VLCVEVGVEGCFGDELHGDGAVFVLLLVEELFVFGNLLVLHNQIELLLSNKHDNLPPAPSRE